MKEKSILLVEILSAAIRKREFQIDKYKTETIDWNEIYAQAVAHKVHTLIYPVIKKIDPRIGPDEKLMARWNISVMACGIQMICNEIAIGYVIETLNTARIKTIVLKGMSINKCYPYPELRIMKDMDMMVHEEDIDRATKILEGLGYIVDKGKKIKNTEFFNKKAVSIRLHRLLVDYDFMQNKESFDQEIWENPVELDLGVAKAHVMSWEFQVINICIHMIFNTTCGGIGLRQLCDLVLVVETRGNQIDWDMVTRKSLEYGIDKFVYAIFMVCNKLFQMEIPENFMSGMYLDELYVQKLKSDIFCSKNFRSKDKITEKLSSRFKSFVLARINTAIN